MPVVVSDFASDSGSAGCGEGNGGVAAPAAHHPVPPDYGTK